MKFVAFALLLIPCLLSAQTEVEITAEPHHHLEFQNNFVRAFKVNIPPHEATLLHRHRHDYFVIALAASDLSSEEPGKPAGSIKLKAGETGFHAGSFAHLARNQAATAFPHVDVEILQPTSYKWEEDRGLHIHEGGTSEILLVKDGVRATEVDLQPRGMMHKHQHTSPYLVVAITDVNLHSDSSKGMKMVKLKAGEVAWSGVPESHSIMNMGPDDAKFVVLEFPPTGKK
jgi:hypothetical protein